MKFCLVVLENIGGYLTVGHSFSRSRLSVLSKAPLNQLLKHCVGQLIKLLTISGTVEMLMEGFMVLLTLNIKAFMFIKIVI